MQEKPKFYKEEQTVPSWVLAEGWGQDLNRVWQAEPEEFLLRGSWLLGTWDSLCLPNVPVARKKSGVLCVAHKRPGYGLSSSVSS